jgi:chemotaxis protein CheD
VAELMVRMAEIAASQHPGDVLVSLGLGSCIGVALMDESRRAVGLAHVVLPSSSEAGPGRGSAPKFADTAVPLLIDEVSNLGAARRSLFAVLVGGAQMFSLGGPSMDVGSRNAAAVRDALSAAAIPVRAEVVGGSIGRTIRVYVGTGQVTCKEAGGKEIDVLAGVGPTMEARAA